MRKALIGLILAATASVPAAAWAQDWHHDGGRGERNHNDGGQARSQRQAQQAPRQVQQAPQGQFVARPRGDNNVARGNWQGRTDFGNRGSWRGRNDANNTNVQSNEQRGNWRGRDRTNQQSIYPQAWQGNPNDPRLRHYEELERRNQQNYDNNRGNWRNNDRGNDRGNWRNNDRGNDRGNWRNNDRGNWRGDNRGRTGWNREWRNDNRYDWRRFRNYNRGLFHVGPYYSPYRGYGYNRFSIGVFLDPFFYDQRYWIGDPWEYRLPPAEPGTEWVRYYNDVLLVDVETGEVLDTIYDFFW